MCYEGYEVPFALNHITYRGYYRDEETGFYYLKSRYYDSTVCRFINADDTNYLGESETVWSYNLYSYCENNPIKYIDPNGNSILLTVAIFAAVGALVGGAAGYALSRILKVPKGNRWKYVIGGATIGAVIGGCIGYAVGASAAGGSGIVLWSGGGMQGAGGVAQQFAIKNGLKTLEMTRKGKLLTSMNKAAIKVLGKTKGYKFMKPLWNLGSKQFVKSKKGSEYVHVFLSVSNFSSESVFAKIEYPIVRELGIKIIWHFIK